MLCRRPASGLAVKGDAQFSVKVRHQEKLHGLSLI